MQYQPTQQCMRLIKEGNAPSAWRKTNIIWIYIENQHLKPFMMFADSFNYMCTVKIISGRAPFYSKKNALSETTPNGLVVNLSHSAFKHSLRASFLNGCV